MRKMQPSMEKSAVKKMAIPLIPSSGLSLAGREDDSLGVEEWVEGRWMEG